MNILGYSIILSFLTFVNFSDNFTKIQGEENILTSLILPLTRIGLIPGMRMEMSGKILQDVILLFLNSRLRWSDRKADFSEV